MMMQRTEKKEWDVEWDYTMGMPEDCGFGLLVEGLGKSVMTDDGLSMSSVGGSYIRYTAPQEVCVSGAVECVAVFKSTNANNGFRLCLSNGEYGAQIYVKSNKLYIAEGKIGDPGQKFTEVKPIGVGKEYLIRMEFDDVGVRVFLNGETIYEKEEYCSLYCVGNRIFQQDGGETVLKSLKYKFG